MLRGARDEGPGTNDVIEAYPLQPTAVSVKRLAEVWGMVERAPFPGKYADVGP